MNRAERRRAAETPQAVAARRRGLIIYASIGLVAVVAIVAVALAVRAPQNASEAPTIAQISVGQAAPEFTVSTNMGPFDLANAGARPTLLEVFATWCPHCQHEVSVINPLYASFHDRVNILGVSGSPYAIDGNSPETQADVMSFVSKLGVHYPIAFDPALNVAHAYMQSGYPTIVLIGADKKILAIGSGELTPKSLRQALTNALAGKPVNPTFGS